MAEKVVSQIEFEIGQIDRLFEAYADLLERSQKTTPDLIEITALASVLHSFYRGEMGDSEDFIRWAREYETLKRLLDDKKELAEIEFC